MDIRRTRRRNSVTDGYLRLVTAWVSMLIRAVVTECSVYWICVNYCNAPSKYNFFSGNLCRWKSKVVRAHISIRQYARVHHTPLQIERDCSDFQNSCSFIGLRGFWLRWQLPVQAEPALRLSAAKCSSVVCYLKNQPMFTTKYWNHTIQPAQNVNSKLYVTCLCNHTLTHY